MTTETTTDDGDELKTNAPEPANPVEVLQQFLSAQGWRMDIKVYARSELGLIKLPADAIQIDITIVTEV